MALARGQLQPVARRLLRLAVASLPSLVSLSRRIRDHIRNNLWGIVAVFIALGGTAAALPGRNKVDSGDIKKAAVHRSDLAPSSVDSSKVADGSLTGADVDESTLNIPQPEIPSTLPPSGPAGGDLSNEFPDPQVRESGLSAGGDLTGTVANAQLGPDTVGDAEATDVTRTIQIPASQIGTGAFGAGMSAGNVGGAPSVFMSGVTNAELNLAVEVPADRVPGTGMSARVLLSGHGSGNVNLSFSSLAIDSFEPVNGALVPGGSFSLDPSVAADNSLLGISTNVTFALGSATVNSGDLLLVRIARSGATDTNDNAAAIHSVAIDYTAKR